MSIKSKISAVVFVSLSLGFPVASYAQTPDVDTKYVAAECAKSAALCQAAVEAAIAALKAMGLTPTQFNTQLGVLASAALSGAKDLPAAEKMALAGTLNAISEASTDPAQKAALTELATQLSDGVDVDLNAFAAAISAN